MDRRDLTDMGNELDGASGLLASFAARRLEGLVPIGGLFLAAAVLTTGVGLIRSTR